MINSVIEPAVAMNFFAGIKTDTPLFKREILNILVSNYEIHSLFGELNDTTDYLPARLINIDFLSLIQSQDYIVIPGDINTSRVNLLKYSFDNDLYFIPFLNEYNIEDYLEDVLDHHPECLNHAKKSLLINNLVDFFCFFELPEIDKSLSDDLLSDLGNFKDGDFYPGFAKGLLNIADSLDGYYNLNDENIRFLRKELSNLETRIIEITKQEDLLKFDVDSLLSDSISIFTSGLLPGLPISTLKELFEKMSKVREFKENPKLQFSLALSILKKSVSRNLEESEISGCQICKLSVAEIEQLDEKECHEVLHNASGDKCINHTVAYLDGRKKHRLIGKKLLKYMKGAQTR
ncbi:MAG: hypothetical protein WDZ80_04350 [Candidatus Paceibacterota bacterium]